MQVYRFLNEVEPEDLPVYITAAQAAANKTVKSSGLSLANNDAFIKAFREEQQKQMAEERPYLAQKFVFNTICKTVKEKWNSFRRFGSRPLPSI